MCVVCSMYYGITYDNFRQWNGQNVNFQMFHHSMCNVNIFGKAGSEKVYNIASVKL